MKRWWNSRGMRRLRRDKLAMVCLGVVVAYMITAVLVHLNLLATGFEERVGDKYLSPSLGSVKTWLGTDRLGRSIFWRMIYAVKIAATVGFVSALIGSSVGAILGAIAGYFGRWVDDCIVWLYSTLQSIPYLVLLLLIAYVVKGHGLLGLYIAFGATFWIGPCRVVRGEVMRLRELEYIEAARAIGCTKWRILFRHILPNTLHVVFVYFALLFVAAIKAEVIITFLGLGVQGTPSWGIMIKQSSAELINGFYWQLLAATGAMLVLVLSFNVLADALQDALDPKAS